MRLPSGRLAGSILPLGTPLTRYRTGLHRPRDKPLGTISPQLRYVDYPIRVSPRTNCRPCRQLMNSPNCRAVHRQGGKRRIGMRLPSGRLAGSILSISTLARYGTRCPTASGQTPAAPFFSRSDDHSAIDRMRRHGEVTRCDAFKWTKFIRGGDEPPSVNHFFWQGMVCRIPPSAESVFGQYRSAHSS
jgi:hypothetical protein